MLQNVNKSMLLIPKGLSFSTLNLTIFKISNCIVFLYIHRAQLHLHLSKLIIFSVTLKLNQLLRKFMWRYLWISATNTVHLKEIEQMVFKQWTIKICKTFFSMYHIVKISMVNTHYENCCNFIGQHGKVWKLSSNYRRSQHTKFTNVNRNMWVMSKHGKGHVFS